MPPQSDDDTSSLERARRRLYDPHAVLEDMNAPFGGVSERSLPHAWEDRSKKSAPQKAKRHLRFAGIFFATALLFFLASSGVVGYLFYFGGNTVSVDKVDINIQGPTAIAGGDTVPFSLVITNRNPVALENVTIEIEFPAGTREAGNVLQAYPRYSGTIGTLESGATATRSIKAVVFGRAGESVSLPVTISYATPRSNAVFEKKTSYALTISSTPLSISVDTLSETVSGKPITFTLTVRSNATVPLDNVVLAGAFPFGFSATSSSLPLNNSSFLLGTISPGASKEVTLVGTLFGQDKEQRVFKFTVGTANTPTDQTPAVVYMSQDASVAITAPFISATLALGGDTKADPVVSSGSSQSVTVSYANTLPVSITNAEVAVAISGSAVDYNSIKTTNGFYRSADRTVVFSRDTDSSLASLPPGASGTGMFSFSVLPAEALGAAPTITLSLSVSGTRVGQTNVPEEVRAFITKTAKVATTVVLSASALHAGGSLSNSGPIPPKADQATTYTVVFGVENKGSAVAGGSVTATLPGYVSYTGLTGGAGSFSYNEVSRTVSWSPGDLAQGAATQGFFQVSIVPSTSQRGSAPLLTGRAIFSGYDRFAGVQVSAAAEPVTTDIKGDPGYSPAKAVVQ